MITVFHVTGNYVYVEPDGRAVDYEDVFTKLDLARALRVRRAGCRLHRPFSALTLPPGPRHTLGAVSDRCVEPARAGPVPYDLHARAAPPGP